MRGDRWPVAPHGRSSSAPAWAASRAVTVSGLDAYDTTLLSVHMVQHMVLSMVAPIFLALGAPVTLALRTLPVGPRKRAAGGRCTAGSPGSARFPLVAFAIFVVNPFVLYFTDLYRLHPRARLGCTSWCTCTSS